MPRTRSALVHKAPPLARPLALTLALLAPATAAAQARPVTLSLVEHGLGASPVYMVAGHGRLNAGVTREGDIAVLTWPSPSCCDQLTHLAPNDPDARDRPRTGMRDGFGIALGLRVRTATETRVLWLHDASAFAITPGYAADDVLEPTVRYTHTALGLTVVVDDAVLPDRDVLQRRVRVTRAAGSPVTGIDLVTHTNLGLTQNVVPRLPFGDVVADSRNDFGALWDAQNRAAVHFRPRDRAPVNDLVPLVMPAVLPADFFGPLDALMRDTGDVTAGVAALAGALDATFGAGVYAVVATDPPAEQHQIGREGSAFCDELSRLINNVQALGAAGIQSPIDPAVAENFRCPPAILPAAVAAARGWTRVIPSAWDDAQDGDLAGNPVAAYVSDSAQRTPVALDAAGAGEVRVLIAFGSTAAEARAALAAGTALPAAGFIARDADAWTARARALALPDTLPDTIAAEDRARIVRAARRAMLHVYNGTDPATGMIVASIARQAPYGLDWPRDGAFFGYALDVAGNPAAVARRLGWALPLARTAPLTASMLNALTDPAPPVDPRNNRRQYPEAAWEMNYYDTGAMGGFYRFEIDNTALMVWSAATHVGYAPEAERRALAAQYFPQIQRSADLLAAWRDPTNGLDAVANEDDNAAFTSSLHGGVTVFAALEGAARVARYTGDTASAARWEHRAGELRDALVARFYDVNAQRFINVVEGAAAGNPGSASLGPTAWLVWPARMLPYSDPRVARQVRYDLEQVLATLRGDAGSEGGAYLVKNTLAAAMFLASGGDPTLRPLLEEAVTRLARDVITQDTQVMGEVFVTIRNPDGTVARRENRVSIPHLWEGTLFYLTTMAMAHPERFEQDLHALPPNQTPAPGTVPFHPDSPDGGTPSMDAGGAVVGPLRGGGCGCATPGRTGRGAAGAALLALALVAAGRRQRRA